MAVKKVVKNLSLLCLSSLVSIAIAEGVCRAFFDPVDFLVPKLVDDDWLLYRIPPNSGGHDEFGFRNKRVPLTAKIVAIGDSNTYGLAATRKGSWPNQLGKRTGETVYNMGLGGYGPMQYLKLLQSRAMQLDPEIILMGLYFGNDFVDTYRLIYLQDRWKRYRNAQIGFDNLKHTIVDDGRSARNFPAVRNWLSRNSVFYMVLVNSVRPIISEFQSNQVQEKDRAFHETADGAIVRFNAVMVEHALNFERPELAEGFRLAMLAFSEIKSFCDDNDLKLLVLIMPTKEFVYSDLIINSEGQRQKEVFKNIVASETFLRDEVFSAFGRDGIDYVDLLPVFSKNAVSRQIYPGFNTHPNAAGYQIVADTVAQKLQELQY